MKSLNSNNLILKWPDGRLVEGAEFSEFREQNWFAASNLDSWRLNKVDIQAFTEGDSLLLSVGIGHDESILAVGAAKIGEFPDKGNSHDCFGVLTLEHLVFGWNQFRSKKGNRYLVLPLRNFSGLTSTGPWSGNYNVRNSIHFAKDGVFEIGETYIEISERIAKDGQANRRSICLMDSFAKRLMEVGRELKVDLSDPDYENSEAAILAAKEIIIITAKQTPHTWLVRGLDLNNNWVQRHQTSLPDELMEWNQWLRDNFWESFSGTLLELSPVGNWYPPSRGVVKANIVKVLNDCPKPISSTEKNRNDFSDAFVTAMDITLNRDEQFLAQVVINQLTVSWLHYIFPGYSEI
jgi:hypothetical protein